MFKKKLSKKLAKYVSAEDYKDELAKYKEHVKSDVVLKLTETKLKEFIEASSDADHKKYVDGYGGIKLLKEYFDSPKPAKISKLSENEIYKVLSVFLFEKDDDVYVDLVKKFNKYIDSLLKADKPKKVSEKKPAKKVSKKKTEEEPEESEPEESDADEESEEEDEHEESEEEDDM